MAETYSMEPTPEMADAKSPKMSVTAAMDLLDEHGVTAKNYMQIMDAIEVAYGEDEAPSAPEMPDDQAMLDQAFASGRMR